MPGNHKNLIIDRSDIMRDDIVAQFKDNLSSLFDYIIFDTPPAGLLQESALAAADIIVIPSKAECKGLDAINQTLMAINRLHAGKETALRCLSTMYDRRISEHRTNADLIQGQLPNHLHWRHPYRSQDDRGVASYGKTIWGTILVATHATSTTPSSTSSQPRLDQMSSRYSTCIICHHPVVEIAGRWYHIATSTIPTQMCDSPTAKPIEHGGFRFYVPTRL